MALLNFGNAIAGFGKAAAALGLDSVKATLEQDKVRLAAELAEESTIRGEERKWTAEQTQQPIRATWALDAVKNAKQAEIDLATDPTNIDKITKAKTLELTALDNFQTTLDKQHANDPKWVAAQKVKYDALNPYASAEAAYKNIQTSAATLKYDTDINIKDLTGKIATETDPAKKQTLTAERDAKAWSIEGDRAERIANRQERASVGTYIASQQTELARLKQAGALDNDPDVEAIRSSLPGFQSLYKRLTEEAYPKDKVSPAAAATPTPAPTPGSAATPGKPADASLKIGGRTVVVSPSPLAEVGTGLMKVANAATSGKSLSQLEDEDRIRSEAEGVVTKIETIFAKKGQLEIPSNYSALARQVSAFPDLVRASKPVQDLIAFAAEQDAKEKADKAAKKKPGPTNNNRTTDDGINITRVPE